MQKQDRVQPHHQETDARPANVPVPYHDMHAEIDTSGVLHWESEEVEDSTEFIVQQFKWNRWVNVDTVKGTEGDQYHFTSRVYLFHGKNRIRILHHATDTNTYADTVSMDVPNIPEVSYACSVNMDKVKFSAETPYEIIDAQDHTVRSVFGKSVSVKDLDEGMYFLNVENKTEEIIVRKTW